MSGRYPSGSLRLSAQLRQLRLARSSDRAARQILLDFVQSGALLYLLFLERRQGARRFKQVATPKVPESALGNWKNVDRGSIHAVNREEVDRILDKISASGLASLTPQERQFLSNFVPPDDRKPA